MSSGAHGVVREAFTWVAVLGVLAVVVVNFDEIRAFNARLAGIEPAAEGAPYAGDAVSTPSSPMATQRNGDEVELRSDRRGHFEAEAEINGRDISALVDTGASMVVLTYEDAERAGIFVRPADFTSRSRTANGTARNAPVTLDEVCVRSVCVRDVPAMVAEPGRLHVTLLGMTFLGRLSRVDMRGGTLVLEN